MAELQSVQFERYLEILYMVELVTTFPAAEHCQSDSMDRYGVVAGASTVYRCVIIGFDQDPRKP